MDNLLYDEYAFYWTAAINGEDAFGDPHDADYNQDGNITMDEAFIYAEAHDTQEEEPQYGDYPEGIGKTIKLGSLPPETPTTPEGPDELLQYEEGTFSTSAIEPEGGDVYYIFDWGNGNFSDWIGPYASGETGEASYSWAEIGVYEIRAIAKDIDGVPSNWSEPTILTIVENQVPERPAITGKHIGFGGKEYDFTFISTDPDGHDILYKVDWDDGKNTGWLGPYSSSESITLNHSWNRKGEYMIKAWAKDVIGYESGQGMFKINILTNKAKTAPVYKNMVFFRILENLISRFPIIYNLLNG